MTKPFVRPRSARAGWLSPLTSLRQSTTRAATVVVYLAVRAASRSRAAEPTRRLSHRRSVQ